MKRVIKAASNSDVAAEIIANAESIVETCLNRLGILVEEVEVGRGTMLSVTAVVYNGHTYTSKGWHDDVYSGLWSRPFDATKINSIKDYKETSSYANIVSTVFLYEIYGYSDKVKTLQSWATQALQSAPAASDGTYIEGSFDRGSFYMTPAEYQGVYKEDKMGHITMFTKFLDVYYQGEFNEELSNRVQGNFGIWLGIQDAIDFAQGRFSYSDMERLVIARVESVYSYIPEELSKIQKSQERNAFAAENFKVLSAYLESRLSEFNFQCDDYDRFRVYGTYVLFGETYDVSTEIELYIPPEEFEPLMATCYRRLRKSILRKKNKLAKTAQDSAML